ncbi:hypothetical protein Tco_1515258 [Tanacetum coccineum]
MNSYLQFISFDHLAVLTLDASSIKFIPNNFADSEKKTTVEVLESDEELDTMMEGNHNVPYTLAAQVDDTTSIKVDKNTKDLKKKRGMITNDIFKMTSLNQQEKYEVIEKIQSDVGYVDAYWDMDDTNQDADLCPVSAVFSSDLAVFNADFEQFFEAVLVPFNADFCC